MHATVVSNSLLGYFNLGGGEIILILAFVLILFGAKKLPDLAQGLGRGIDKFRDAVDDEASEAGRSAGGIYFKSAAQALTPDNQVAELYNPGVFSREKRPRRRGRLTAWFVSLYCWARPGRHGSPGGRGREALQTRRPGLGFQPGNRGSQRHVC